MISGHVRNEPGRHREDTLNGPYALILTLAGIGTYQHPQGEFTTRRGNLLLIEPFVPFSWRNTSERITWEAVWFAFSPPESLLPWLHFPTIREGYRLHTISQPAILRRVRRLFLKAHEYASRHVLLNEPLVFNAIEEALIWCQTEVDSSRTPRDPRIDAAMRYLHSHLGHHVQIRDVAKACGTSRTRLLTLFRLQVGMPLMQYLEEERMRRAQQLLKTGMMRVKEVALEVGYADQKYFAKRFKRAFGHRPTECQR
jgi:AraC family transcriptional regulator, arabinose operon regulatory protein